MESPSQILAQLKKRVFRSAKVNRISYTDSLQKDLNIKKLSGCRQQALAHAVQDFRNLRRKRPKYNVIVSIFLCIILYEPCIPLL